MYNILLLQTVCIVIALAVPSSAQTTFTLGFGSTTLLSGEMADCLNQFNNCSGGLAGLMAYGRKYSQGHPANYDLIPEIDVGTPFVQMHPNGNSVNLDVYRHVGISTYYIKPSLLSARQGTQYDRLYVDDIRPIMTNSDVPSDDLWYDYIKHRKIYQFGTSSVGLLYITPSQQSFSRNSVPVLQSAVKNLRRMVDFVVVLYQDRALTGMQALNQLTGDSVPDVLLDVSIKANPLVTTKVTVDGTDVWHTTARVDDRGIFLTVTINGAGNAIDSSVAVVIKPADIPAIDKDQKYVDMLAYMRNMTALAVANDPVVGEVNEAALGSRNGPDGKYRCFAGECAQGTLTARAVAWRYDADFSFFNAGGPRGPGWSPGVLKTSDVWAMCPFPNLACVGEMIGYKVWQLMNATFAHCTFSEETSLLGDRFMQTYGVQLDYDLGTAALAAGTRIKAIRVLNRTTGAYEPLDRLKYYKYATDTYQCTDMEITKNFIMQPLDGESYTSPFGVEILQDSLAKFLRANIPYEPIFLNYLKNTPATSVTEMMVWTQTRASCSRTERWDQGRLSCIVCSAGYERDADDESKCALIPTPVEASKTTTVIIAVVVAVVVFLGIVAGVIFYLKSQQNVRNTKYAPKGNTAAIIFTDIQMSTKLWGTVPASMGAALDQHHAMIRDIIAQHSAYEVKTVGDSFMIACETPQMAADLTMQIQTDFQKASWPTGIDVAYAAESDRDLIDTIDDNPEDCTTVGLDNNGVPYNITTFDSMSVDGPGKKPPAVSMLFHGVRVRIGIHYGPVEAVFDDISKGYDYYGNTVNVAARLESAGDGGQIIISRDVANLLTMNDSIFQIKLLGETQLKGVIGTTELLQLAPISLIDRVFTANAVEQLHEKDQGSDSSKMSVAQSMAENGSSALNERDASIKDCLSRSLKALKADIRAKQIEQLAKAWRVKMLSKNTTPAELEDYTLSVIARRVGAVNVPLPRKLSKFASSGATGGRPLGETHSGKNPYLVTVTSTAFESSVKIIDDLQH